MARGLGDAMRDGLYGDFSEDLLDSVLAEAGRFASEVIAPLNRIGDRHGTPFKDGVVTTPPGWKEAYTAWSQAGWNGLAAPEQVGRPGAAAGASMPPASRCGTRPPWPSASARCSPSARSRRSPPMARDELKQRYLPKLVSGEWMGTMQLTEPQAGLRSSALLRTKAERAGDGTYRITGQKIFITYGEHDLTDNIIHFVLARLPDAPPGTRGISLFLVPKFLLNAGRLARRPQRRARRIRSSTSSAFTARPPAP